jgi:hypothetical protein
MKLRIANLLTGILFISLFNINAQELEWARKIGGSGNSIPFKSIVDNLNNIYIVGYFTGTISQDSYTFTTGTTSDAFIAKYDSSGTLLWMRQIGGTGNEEIRGIALNNTQDTLYVVGYFQNTCTFSTGQTLTVTGTATTTNYDVFLAKYLPDSTFASCTKIAWGNGGNNDKQDVYDLKIDNNGHCLITGTFRNRVYFNGGSITSSAGYDTTSNPTHSYILKFYPDGNRIISTLVRSYGTGAYSQFHSIDITNNSYYFGGGFADTLYFNNDTLMSYNNNYSDAFIYKTDYNLNRQFIRKVGGNGNFESFTSISCDSLGNVYFGGLFTSTSGTMNIETTNRTIYLSHPDANSGSQDIIFGKYLSNGTLSWINTMGSAANDNLARALYGSGIFTMCGKFNGNFSIGDKDVTYVGGDGDMIGLVYDHNDNLEYAIPFTGSGNDAGRSSIIDNVGNYLFIGDYRSNPFISTDVSLTNSGLSDVAIVKYKKGSLDKNLTNVACRGDNTGSIIVTPKGPLTPPYSYSWTKISDGSFTSTGDSLFNLTAGVYPVLFTDDNGFTLNDTVTLTEPATNLLITLDSFSNVYCKYDTTGRIYTTALGGTAPYSYLWTTTNGSHLTTTQPDQLHVTAGNYKLYVTDGNGCIDSISQTLIEPASKLDITTVNVTQITGPSSGAIDITVVGGYLPSSGPRYQFSWIGPSYTSSLEDISGLANSGYYSCTVTDSVNCVADTTISLPDTSSIFINVVSKTNVTCNGLSNGSATIQAINAKGGIRITWSTGAHTATVSGLSAGTYTVEVSDSGRVAPDSIANATVIISEPLQALSATTSASNINCYGDNNGAINLSVSGGTLPYTYQWTSDAIDTVATEDISSLPSARYYYSITDKNGCSASGSDTITSPTAISIVSIDPNNQTCLNGKNDGYLAVTVTGGTPYPGSQYYFTWSNGVMGLNKSAISSLSPNTYSVNIADQSGCSIPLNYTIDEGLAVGGTTTSQSISCFGVTDGQVSVTATPAPGRTISSYLWNTPALDETATATSLDPGTYTVTVEDNLGCQAYFTSTVLPKTALGLTENLTNHINVTCNGALTGQLGVTASGGSGLYEYQLDGDGWGTSEIFSGLAAGNHSVVLRDRNSTTCTYSGLGAITITQPTALSLTENVLNHVNVTCNGALTGVIEVTATGGSGVYEYSIDGGSNWQNSNVFSGLAANTYNIWVRDFNVPTCQYTGLSSITITQPIALGLTENIVNHVNVTCNGASTGQIQVVPSGGSGNYEYSSNAGTNWQASSTFTGLAANIYTIWVRDASATTCIYTGLGAITITEPAALGLSEVVASHVNVTCTGGNNGQFEVLATGGSGSYEYRVGVGAWGASEVITGLTANSYNVTVRDASATTCIYAGMPAIVITQPASLPVATATNSIPTCIGSAISLTGGANGMSNYSWTGPNGFTSNSQSPSITGSATAAMSGTYTLTVTDASSCTNSASTTITINSLPVATAGNNGPVCENASLTLTGGPGSMTTYAWSGPNTFSDNTQSPVVSANATLAMAGIYTITVTDANGCSATANTSVTVNPLPIQPAVFTASSATVCQSQNGVVYTVPNDATVTYNWSYSETGATINGTTNSVTVDFSSTATSGTLSVTATNGCGTSIARNVAITVNPLPNQPAAFTNSLSAVCQGQSGVTYTVPNDATVTYNWSYSGTGATIIGTTNSVVVDFSSSATSGTLSVTATNGCGTSIARTVAITVNPIPVVTFTGTLATQCITSTTYTLSGGSPVGGIYSGAGVTGTNFNASVAGIGNQTITYTYTSAGCSNFATNTISVVSEPVANAFIINDILCNGDTNGSARVTATGGTGNYSYSWNSAPVQTNDTAINLTSGIYTATVSDVTGCSSTDNVTLSSPLAIVVNALLINNVTCNGMSDGSARVTASNGVAPYSYSWDIGQTNDTAINLDAGLYIATVTDDNNCMASGSINITTPAALGLNEVLASHKDQKCGNDTTGVIEVLGSGGSGNYEYSANSDVTWQTAPLFDKLQNGNYKVKLRDANSTSCVYSGLDSITIAGALPIVANINVTNITCYGLNNGVIASVLTGGNGTLQLLWDDPLAQTNDTIANLSPGIYNLTATDDSSCVQQFPATVIEPDTFVISLASIINNKCFGDSTGAIYTNVLGGTAPYSFLWSNDSITQNISDLKIGNYNVTATDNNGCISGLSGDISEPTAISANYTIDTVSCYGFNDGQISVFNVAGGNGGYTFLWDDATSSTNDTLYNVAAGFYNLVIADDSSCIQGYTIEMPQPDSLFLLIGNITDALCVNTASGLLSVIPQGGYGNYEYKLNDGAWQADSIFENLTFGEYIVLLRDSKEPGCIYDKLPPINITEPDSLKLASIILVKPSTVGGSDGSITINASGGNNPIYLIHPSDVVNTTGVFQGLKAGNYVVEINDENGCGPVSSELIRLDDPTSVIEINIEKQISMFPNPTDGLFNIKLVDSKSDKMKVEIFNILGAKVYEKEYNNKIEYTFTEEIDFNSKPKGIYIIKVNNEVVKDRLIIR